MLPNMTAFRSAVAEELQKEANTAVDFVKKHGGTLGHAAEIGGLGILAKPSVSNLRKKNATKEEKSHAKYELAGLGVLAAPSAVHMAHSAWKKFHP